jgi:IS605 OrfB family transposase
MKFRFIPYDPVWFHVKPNPFSQKYLDKLLDGNAENGSCELHLHEDGSLVAHQTVKWDVDVLEDEDVETAIGVDIGENVLHAMASMGRTGEVLDVEMQSGREFRHYRERLKQKRKEMQQKDDLRGVKQCKGEHERYTDQSLDTSSREIIDFALSFDKPKIVLEDLTDYRETAEDPLHDWPYGEQQEKIMYKAKAEGIPVEIVEARNTSSGCRKCGQVNQEYRDGPDFHCRRCGYEVHADVNAAMNLAQAGLERKA